MKCRWFRRLLLSLLGIALAPLLIWSLVVLVAPTNWARSKVVAALERSSGRSVDLAGLRLCFGGGFDLKALKIGAPGSKSDPWLVAEKVHLDLGVWQLLRGRLDATSLKVDGLDLRVRRRADGTFELADLISARTETPRDLAASSSTGPTHLDIQVRRARIHLIDEPTQADVVIEQAAALGTWEEGKTITGSLQGKVNQGDVHLTGSLNRIPGRPSFEGQLWANRVMMDDGMAFLRYLVPVMAGATPRIQGDLTMEMYLRGDGDTRERLRETLVGHGRILIDPIQLEGTELITEVEKSIPLPSKSRVGSLRSDIKVKEGRVTTSKLALNLAKAPLVISGWTDFDGRLDYRMGLDGIVDRVPARARQFLADMDLDLDVLSSLRLSGTVDNLDVSVMGKTGESVVEPAAGVATPADRQNLKVLSRELRERLLR